MQPQPIRAAIYARISLDTTGDRLGVERQLEDARKLATHRGWTVVEEYVDNSLSAFKRTTVRPAYQRMLSDFRSGRFDALLVYDLDRLTRQPRQLEDWIEYAEERGLQLVTTNGEADLTTDGGRMFARIKAAVARQESERKGKRQERAIQQRVEAGKPLSGTRLTGYKADGTIDLAEAQIVRDVFAWFAAGDSLKGIARRLDAEGVPARNGTGWNPSTVRTMLTNSRYAGRVMFKGEQTAIRGTWEPIIGEDVFESVQSMLNDPRRKLNREGTARKWLGSSLYRCGVCGGPVRTNGPRYWCPEGGHVTRAMHSIDRLVLAVVAGRLARPDVADLLATSTESDADDHAKELSAIQARISRFESDYDAGLIDGRRYKAASAKAEAELSALRRKRASSVANSQVAALLSSPNPGDVFLSSPLDIQRAIIGALVIVTLHKALRGSKRFDPETVTFEWLSEVT